MNKVGNKSGLWQGWGKLVRMQLMHRYECNARTRRGIFEKSIVFVLLFVWYTKYGTAN